MKTLTLFLISACILSAIHGASIPKLDSLEVKSDDGNKNLNQFLESAKGALSEAVDGIKNVNGKILDGVDKAIEGAKNAAEKIMDKFSKPNPPGAPL